MLSNSELGWHRIVLSEECLKVLVGGKGQIIQIYFKLKIVK